MANNKWGESRHVKIKSYHTYSNINKYDGCQISSIDLIVIKENISSRRDIEKLIEHLTILKYSLEDK